MLEQYQIIYQKIGKLLWSIMPTETQKIVFLARIYDNVTQAGTRWFDQDGTEHNFYQGWDNPIQEIDDEIVGLLENLQKLPLFQTTPWTQCQVTLQENGKFNIEFAYIPEEDSWPGLYMRGISSLTKEELGSPYYIPEEIWEERVASRSLHEA